MILLSKVFERLQLAGLTDETGNLPLFVHEQTGIFAPSEVQSKGGVLIYPPFPENMHLYNNRDSLITWLLQNDWTKRENINTKKMFEEFLALSNIAPYSERTIEKYKHFALKYGPLWEGGHTPPEIKQKIEEVFISRVYEEEGKKKERAFRTTKPAAKFHKLRTNGLQILKPHKIKRVRLKRNIFKFPSWYKSNNWYGYEEAIQWHLKAKEVEAIFNIAIYLLKGESPSEESWEEIKFEGVFDFDIEIQRQILASIVTAKLKSIVGLRVNWDKGFKITIDSGLGFMGIIWLHVAQTLTKNFSICTCDGCGKPYVRTGRKPQKGRRNFCSICGEDNKGSKRLWARKSHGGRDKLT